MLPPGDPELPELTLLLGREADDVLGTALGEAVVGARPKQIRYVPGRSVTIAYALRPDNAGSPTTAVVRAGTGLPSASLLVTDGGSAVAVWTPTTDPRLPGLRTVLDRRSLADLLAEVGVIGNVEDVRLRSYRPGRRAVVEVEAGGHRLFVKVVRPDRIEGLQRTHVAIAPLLRVPRSLGWSPELGLAVLEALPGKSLRTLATQDSPGAPRWGDLAAMLDRLPDLPGRRPGLIERTASHADLVTTLLPDQAASLHDLTARVETAADAEITAAHNDFHSEQILVGSHGIGLIDIDTAGGGYRIDDAALLIGHLFTSALESHSGPAMAAYGGRLLAGAEERFDRRDLRLRVAAAVLAFATAPFRRFQEGWDEATRRRIQAATEWADSAG